MAESESALVAAARTDRRAFGALYDRHFETIYHYVACRVEDAAVAEDLTAAVWERALRAIERYEIRGLPFLAWLYRIAGNLVANHHRHRGYARTVALSASVASGERRAAVEERLAVRAALVELSAADQEVLGLHYYAGLKPMEMAEVLGCSTQAVHKRLHRARERLRVRYEGRPGGASADG